MAAGPWVIYSEAKVSLGTKIFNLSTDAFQLALFASTSNCGSASLVSAVYATLTGELATVNGYTLGGAAAATPTWTNTAGTITFDTADVSWTASGGSLVARFAVLYDNTATSKNLLAYMLLDSTPADVTTTTGNTITIQITNVFSLT